MRIWTTYFHICYKNAVFRIRIRMVRMFFGPPGSASGSVIYSYGSGSFYHQAKKWRKTLISAVLWLLCDFLSLKKWCKGTVKKKKNIKTKIVFFLSYEGHWRKEQEPDPHPDPYQNVTDPEDCINESTPLELFHNWYLICSGFCSTARMSLWSVCGSPSPTWRPGSSPGWSGVRWAFSQGLQRDIVCLCWPIAPS